MKHDKQCTYYDDQVNVCNCGANNPSEARRVCYEKVSPTILETAGIKPMYSNDSAKHVERRGSRTTG